ncbi:MAG: peptidoglycan DD-metalloendopeptidase family protein [Drouetiella hepatica Uher 2000/2452]|jgi:murein DD-endopeptidase MepM/ murein hydrolase activator NlpD|uniref:Peptidoglycan DD-metalloendopeptidase family protein n=1 Tax=Drouetiella hepatica Uher 2000/2452 TaxID=904376 RepID=A0A951UMM5_9CYAN|nr:peptidoglycan DD-metalloendopeptidase family protein [Drouetiella hepatica Uher 2000/2452]
MLVSPAIASPLNFLTLAQAPDSVQQLQQQKQKIEQERSHLNQKQDQLQQQEQSAQKKLGGLQKDIKATSQQIAQNEKQIADANRRLKTLESNLVKAEKSYAAKQTATVARLRFLQRQQSGQGLAVLLQSQNLNEFLDRRQQLRLVYGRDRTILADLQAEANDLNLRRRKIETQKNDIAILTQELLAQKAQAQEAAQYQQGLITHLRQDRKALEAAEDQLTQDSANLTALIQQRLAASNKYILRGTGKMTYPSDGEITSGFGYRMHPILGYTRFHSGIDFGVDYGSSIHAADAGVVIFAGWYGGYGQAIIIDHGKNITTLYGHTSEMHVSEGQTVQRGQVIGAVGSSGLSTGPHLHFEVHISGEPIDPVSYL